MKKSESIINRVYLGLLALMFVALGYVAYANIRLPYGDHIVVALNLEPHSLPYHQLFSKALLSIKQEPRCRITGTFDDGMVISTNNGTLQFLIAAWEKQVNNGMAGENVDRKLLLKLLNEAIEECDPNSFSPRLGPFRPLIYGILLRDVEMLRRLLERGANPLLRIERPGKKVDGMSAIEFAQLIAQKPLQPDDQRIMEKMILMMESIAAKAAKRSGSPTTLLEQLKRIHQQTVEISQGQRMTGLTEIASDQKSLFAALELTAPTPSDLAKPIL